MALPNKRSRGIISYREPSTTDEDLSESGDTHTSKKKRALPVRRSARRQSNDPDERSTTAAAHTLSPAQPQSSHAPRSQRKRVQQRVSYKESSTDDSEDDEEVNSEAVAKTTSRRPPPKGIGASPHPSSSGQHKKSSLSTSNRRSLALRTPGANDSTSSDRSGLAASSSVFDGTRIPTDGHKPTLSELPYHVLLQIFVYASHPLHDENMIPTTSISWLVKIASASSAFKKPALTALYRNPPIFALKHKRKDLINLLTSPPTGSLEDYQVMVKCLEIDATQATSPYSDIEMASLVTALTTLRDIDIFDPLDRPPYRGRLRRIRRFLYPSKLFEALGNTNLHLRSWRWNGDFLGSRDPYFMKQLHMEQQAFQSLRDVTFIKFGLESRRRQGDKEPDPEDVVASAINALPRLTFLGFESCPVVHGKLLALLPSFLVSLHVTNCINLTSDALETFLVEKGNSLEELVLNHNQSLGLSFLVRLKASCPRLEALRMDMNYYSSLVLSSDNEPLYDWLLDLDEIPTWPSSLQVLDMEYLRKWSSAAAINFFTSLIDAAGELPQLRELRILAMVDIDWRERANFRRKWAARFEKVFARRSQPPNPHLATLRAFREWKVTQSESMKRKYSLLEPAQEAKENDPTESGSKATVAEKRWTANRLRLRDKLVPNYDETTESDTELDKVSDAAPDKASDDEIVDSCPEEETEEDEPMIIQGNCHTVVFRIDNLRPREELFDEADFLDEEVSGDEEWNGNDLEDDGYAW